MIKCKYKSNYFYGGPYSMKNIINWKLFFILLVACVIASVMVIPYTLALTSNKTEVTPVLLLLSVLQNIVLFAVIIFLGLILSKKTGLGLPILQNILDGKNQAKEIKSILIPSIGLGLLAGVIIVAADIPFTRIFPEFKSAEISIPAWKSLLASFYGGIAEEVLLRLFMLSLIVWIINLIIRRKDGKAGSITMWLSIILAAIIFGLGHLPATSQITKLTGLVVFREIALNGIGGIVFGYLFWKKGLESAMISHFSADIVLHIITPFAASLFM